MNRTSLKTSKIVSYPKSRSRKKGGLKDNLIPDKNDSDSKECSNQEYEIMKVYNNNYLNLCFCHIFIIIDTYSSIAGQFVALQSREINVARQS